MNPANRALFALLTGLLFACTTPAQVIDTTIGSSFNGGIGTFGERDTAPSATETYGQVFRTPAGFAQIDRFTFWLGGSSGPDAVDFAAYIMEWNAPGARATGRILFTSTQQIRGVAPIFPYAPYVFDTGGLILDPARQYVAFLSSSSFLDGIAGTTAVSTSFTNTYAGGDLVFNNNGSSLAALTTTSWGNNGPMDLNFRAEFSSAVAVPEPSTYGLVGSALLIGAVAFRRRFA